MKLIISWLFYSLFSLSLRYKESITKSTRGWKERLFSRNTNMVDLGSEVRRDVDAGIATVSRMMEHLETGDNGRINTGSVSNSLQVSSVPDPVNQQISETGGDNSLNGVDSKASCVTGSASD